MENWATPFAIVAGFVGLVIGYVIGYRGGKVSGELEALKTSMRYDRARRHHGERTQTRSTPETPAQGNASGD